MPPRWGGIAGRVAVQAGILTLILLLAGALVLRWSMYAAQQEATERLAGTQADQIVDAIESGREVGGRYGALPYIALRSDGEIVSASPEFTPTGHEILDLPAPPLHAQHIVGERWLLTITRGPLAGHTLTAVSGTFAGPVASGIDALQATNSGTRADTTSYRVYVLATTDAAEDTVGVLDPFLWGGVLLVVLLVTGTAAVAARRAIVPVEQMRRAADDISGAPVGVRLPEPQPDDELRALAKTLNSMLQRIDDAAERQSRFIADAAHELRTPISSVIAALEIARAHPDALPADRTLRHVEAESRRLQSLANDLLELSSATATERPNPKDRADVIAGVRAAADAASRAAASTGVRITVDGVSPGRLIAADLRESELRRALDNVLDNAVRHAASRVSVHVEVEDSAPTRHVRVEISNDGAPISAADRDSIFQPFVRLDDARARDDGGAGLGLSIARALASGAGGTLEFSQRKTTQLETVFVLALPVFALTQLPHS
jgi:signal transduction histidine kinase